MYACILSLRTYIFIRTYPQVDKCYTDRFWTNAIFALFFLYPALAISTISVFNCNHNVGRLRNDYRVTRPHLLSSASLYSMLFMLIYLFGIPTTMRLVLRLAEIVKVVQEKIEKAEVSAMLALFLKLYAFIEMKRFAQLIGNVDGNEKEFLRQTRQEFDRLLAVQSDGNDEIDLVKLRKIAKERDAFIQDKASAPSVQ